MQVARGRSWGGVWAPLDPPPYGPEDDPVFGVKSYEIVFTAFFAKQQIF